MTEKQLEKIVALWQGRLGLERWKVDVDLTKPCDPANIAEIQKSEFYDSATLRVDPGWRKWAEVYAETTIVHELLHLLHRDTDQAFFDMEGQLQRDAWTLADRRYNHAMEGFIERLACRICELA